MRTSLALMIVIVTITANTATGGKFNRVLSAGDDAPAWQNLPGVDGKTHSLHDLDDNPCVVLVFWANRCPMARMYEARFKTLVEKYTPQKVAFVAISVSNADADKLPAMQQRAKTSGYKFAYLHDATQQTARDYGALVTPQVFVLDADRKVVYLGAIDDNKQADRVKHHYLQDAIAATLAGKPPEVRETLQFGCAIEYDQTAD